MHGDRVDMLVLVVVIAIVGR